MSTTKAESTTKHSSSASPPTRRRRLGVVDRVVVAVMVLIPALLVLWLVWLPAIGSVVLSFGNWNGIGGVDRIQWVGWQNYHDVATIYPPFWPAVRRRLMPRPASTRLSGSCAVEAGRIPETRFTGQRGSRSSVKDGGAASGSQGTVRSALAK